ncbi:MAG: DUF4288 domain-containing protein, partial [Planctomycetia bacterium]
MSSDTPKVVSKRWFGVKTLYQLQGKNVTPNRNCYEERITVWQAESFDQAIEKAVREAQAYAADGTGTY